MLIGVQDARDASTLCERKGWDQRLSAVAGVGGGGRPAEEGGAGGQRPPAETLMCKRVL